MSNDTTITVVGNLTADPEIRFTPSGSPVANFTVASTSRIFDRQSGEWKDGEAMFLNCAVWRQAAENVAESLTKGMRVIVVGRLRSRTYETREGERRTVFEIEVDEIGPALRYATAKVTRVTRDRGPQDQPPPQPQSQPPAPQPAAPQPQGPYRQPPAAAQPPQSWATPPAAPQPQPVPSAPVVPPAEPAWAAGPDDPF